MRKGNGPAVPIEHAHVGLLPRRAGWAAWFNTKPAPVEVYCDVSTVPVWRTRGEVSMVDLDLDVCRTWDGSVRLLDEEEFAEHQVRYGYPEREINAATRTADWLRTALQDDTEPFASAYRPWLAMMT